MVLGIVSLSNCRNERYKNSHEPDILGTKEEIHPEPSISPTDENVHGNGLRSVKVPDLLGLLEV